MTETVALSEDDGHTRDGLVQHRRHWSGPNPEAAMLSIHGIAEHAGRYDHVARHLAAGGVDVLAIDHRGHGLSGGERGHVDTFERFLDDVEDQLREVRRLELPTILFGHSLGGLVCTAYALDGRPLPDALVLSAPALGAQVPGWQRKLAPQLGRRLPRLRIPNDLDGSLLSTDPGVGEAYESDPLRVRHVTASLALEMFSTMDDVNARLAGGATIDVPTLVVHGGDDELVPAELSEPLGDLDNVERIVYPRLRHEVLNEPRWREIADTILEFGLAVVRSDD